MSNISIDEVDRIAKLARLKFTDGEKPKLQKELSDILSYVDQLTELESKAVEPEVDPKALNLMREDAAIQSDDPLEFLQQAPAKEGKYLKVKSVLE